MADEAVEAAEPDPARESADDWAPPRELLTLIAGALAIAFAALIVVGGAKKWTAPTLGVLLLTGGAETLVAIGLAVTCAMAEHRKNGLFVGAIVVTALGALALAGVLLMSGII